MLEMDSRAVCAALQRHKSPIRDLVRRDLDGRAATEEILHAPFFVQQRLRRANRDEKRDRVASLPPEVVELESHRAIFPREPTGGTWISVNDSGVCLALINWHRIAEPASGGQLLPKKRNRSDAVQARSSWATESVETTGCPSGAKRV
jgi:hypothetical protein